VSEVLKIGIPTLAFLVLFTIGGYQAFGNYWIGAVVGLITGLVTAVMVTARRQRRSHWSEELFPNDDGEEVAE
jgi:hypothetical protein